MPYTQIEPDRNGPLTRYVKFGMRMRRECRESFPRHWLQRKCLVSDPSMHHVPWCMSGSLARGGGENSRHSRRMRNPQFCVSGKRPMECTAWSEHRYNTFNCCSCKWHGLPCLNKSTTAQLTDRGLCYTFNGLRNNKPKSNKTGKYHTDFPIPYMLRRHETIMSWVYNVWKVLVTRAGEFTSKFPSDLKIHRHGFDSF